MGIKKGFYWAFLIFPTCLALIPFLRCNPLAFMFWGFFFFFMTLIAELIALG